MRAHGFSQLPVLKDGQLMGILDEWDLLNAVGHDRSQFSRAVQDFMTINLETLSPTASPEALVALYERDLVPIIVHEGRFVGLITKIDYLNYLRRRNHG
jgi:cystathionine beta-synthase